MLENRLELSMRLEETGGSCYPIIGGARFRSYEAWAVSDKVCDVGIEGEFFKVRSGEQSTSIGNPLTFVKGVSHLSRSCYSFHLGYY